MVNLKKLNNLCETELIKIAVNLKTVCTCYNEYDICYDDYNS